MINGLLLFFEISTFGHNVVEDELIMIQHFAILSRDEPEHCNRKNEDPTGKWPNHKI